MNDASSAVRVARAIAIGIALASAALLTRSDARPPDPVDAALAHLAAAAPFRSIEPRLSFDVAYRPFKRQTLRGSERMAQLGGPEADAIIDLLTNGGSTRQTAIARLIVGDPNVAIDMFERDPTTVRGIDAAAAYYSRGLVTGKLGDFARAVQALANVSDSEAALFDRALILEQLCDREAAAKVWRAYLAIDPSSDWGLEARDHLQADERVVDAAHSWRGDRDALLAAASRGDAERVRLIADRHRQSARRLVEMELLPRWGDAWLRGDRVDSEKTLRSASLIADTLRRFSGESLLNDAIDEVRSQIAEGAATQLASVYVIYGKGRREVDSTDYALAVADFSRASAATSSASAHALIAVPEVTARYYLYDYAGALRLIDESIDQYQSQSARYVALFGHLRWLRGLILSAQGNWSGALAEYERSLPSFERLGELEGQVAQHTNLADGLDALGSADRAEVHREAALRLAERIDDTRRLHPLLSEAADAALSELLPAAALQFQDRLVRISRESHNALRIADSLVVRSTIFRRLRNHSAALRDVAEAKKLVPQIADEATRHRVAGDIAAAEAFAYRDRDDEQVIASLTEAMRHYERIGFRMYLAQIFLERGRARVRRSDIAGGESDFRDGIAQLERQRRSVDDSEIRISYFDRAERLFSDLSELLLRRGHPAEAFDLLERARGRELLDSMSGSWTEPLPLAEIQRRLPPGVSLVTYSVLPDGVITFVVRRDSIQAASNKNGEAVLRPLINPIAEKRSQARDTDLRRLSDILVAPLKLPEGRLVFVPDPMLYGVPFAALREGGRMLIEVHEVAIAPSATVAVRPPRSGRDAAQPSILLVASPDGIERLNLPPLPATKMEVAAIAPMYGVVKTIDASGVVVPQVLPVARDYEVLHFAVHAVVDHRNPDESMLLLGSRDGIRVGDIRKTAFKRTRLVVLGGCGTSLGQTHRSEGMLSIARSFLAAGVPSVLGTIAPVEDGPASQLLIEFHREYSRGLDAVAALRVAQLRLLYGRDRVRSDAAVWAAFEVMGGASEARRAAKERTSWASR